MSEIREDQKAQLSFKLSDNSYELNCFVKDVYHDRLSLSFPSELVSYAKYLNEGDEIPVKIFTPSGIRMYNAMVLSSPNEPEFVIEYDENYIQIQRRQYTRAKLETKIIIERLEDENVVTHTIDIGGGGIRFYYEGGFRPDEIVFCRLYMPFMITSIKAKGHIIKKPGLEKNEHVILFSEINEHERDKIIGKCFELETKSKKEEQTTEIK